MKLERSLRTSGVARRIVALFVLCALVPLVATAVLSHDQVRKLLLEQSYLHLAQLTESYASGLYDRLDGAVRNLHGLPADIDAKSLTRVQRERLTAQVDGLGLLAGGTMTQLLGTLRPVAPLSAAEARYLAAGESVLRTTGGTGGGVTLLHMPMDGTVERGVLVADLHPAYLWGENDALPAATNFTVLDGEGALLFASDPSAGAVQSALADRIARTPNGRIVFAGPDGAEVASYRELYLESHFFVHGWTVAATRTEAEVLAPIIAYKRSFLLAIALAILGIALVSAVQIRRTLGPLAKLIAGTRRAANQDFTVRVDVASRDEFGELAASFNAMTARLGRQFTALSTLAEIDRAILSRPDVGQVCEAVLRRIRSIVPVTSATIAIEDRHASNAVQSYRWHSATGDEIALARHANAGEAAAADAPPPAGHWYGATEGEAQPPAVADLRAQGATGVFALPIVWQARAIGIITVGTPAVHALSDDEEARIRDLADRIGVAYASAARDEQLYHQAHYDPLTHLPNRLYFKDELERAIVRAQRDDGRLAVLFIDLDFFKHVNDSVGHAAGDDVLVATATRLRDCVRASDTLARLGGDEFTLLLTDVRRSQDARVVADTVLAALARPFVAGGHEHFLSASIGIALYPSDGRSADELLRNADTAMYRGKDGGRNQSVFFEERMNVAALARVRSERDFRHALDNGDFHLVYQPIRELRTGTIAGAEALLRWSHPEHGMLAPTRFIELAEETGLIDVLGRWVLRAACAQYRSLQSQGIALGRVGVNVSPRQFRQAHFADTVYSALADTGIPPAALELEITESLLLDATPAVESTLGALAASGVRIALDDFGTGYSSLAYLKRYPVHVVKIDRSFVRDLPADRSSAAIAGAIVSMSHALDKQVVAEGVATVEQADLLARIGCDFGQGYWLAKPLRPPELVAFLKSADGATSIARAGRTRRGGP